MFMNKPEQEKNYRFVENWIKENWDELEFRRKLKEAEEYYFSRH